MRAPLAQLVERFHGKEKVTGPIPVGGSKRAPSPDVEFFLKHTPGGVAQLGRASGS